MRLAIVGPGRMGRAVAATAAERGHTITAEIGTGGLTAEAVRGAEVAIEFTTPDAAADNLLTLAGLGMPTVSGTTGWYDRLADVDTAFRRAGVGLVYAPNFSLGVQLLLRAARELARVAAHHPEFDAWIVETHHRRKQDAPSGTARALQNALRAADGTRRYPVTSIRAGEVPGTHSLWLDAAGESVSLTHTARDRSIFARGAVVAAEWLMAHPAAGAHAFGAVLPGEES
jgi:4-hydroxy-tetrahydrodipicolinate reductase